jgi:hypothetical protein
VSEMDSWIYSGDSRAECNYNRCRLLFCFVLISFSALQLMCMLSHVHAIIFNWRDHTAYQLGQSAVS